MFIAHPHEARNEVNIVAIALTHLEAIGIGSISDLSTHLYSQNNHMVLRFTLRESLDLSRMVPNT